jgi:hypothetical protein
LVEGFLRRRRSLSPIFAAKAKECQPFSEQSQISEPQDFIQNAKIYLLLAPLLDLEITGPFGWFC